MTPTDRPDSERTHVVSALKATADWLLDQPLSMEESKGIHRAAGLIRELAATSLPSLDAARTPLDQPEAVAHVASCVSCGAQVIDSESRFANNAPLYTASPDSVRREALEYATKICEQFEAWMNASGYDGYVMQGRKPDGRYVSETARSSWEIWQAARAALPATVALPQHPDPGVLDWSDAEKATIRAAIEASRKI